MKDFVMGNRIEKILDERLEKALTCEQHHFPMNLDEFFALDGVHAIHAEPMDEETLPDSVSAADSFVSEGAADSCSGVTPPPANRGVDNSIKVMTDTGKTGLTMPEQVNGDYHEIAHYGGYDGGCAVGFYGVWNLWEGNDGKTMLDKIRPELQAAKEEAGQSEGDGIRRKSTLGYIELNGIEFKVHATQSRGGVRYAYVMDGSGMVVYIHNNPKEGIQPIRVEYGFYALDKHSLYETHQAFLKWLSGLGFTVTKEVLSRVDLQETLNIDPQVVFRLLSNYCYSSRTNKATTVITRRGWESYTTGSAIQLCIYDKMKELFDHQDDEKMIAVLEHFPEMDINAGLIRIEFRLKRDALKEMQLNTIQELKERENDLIEYLTRWFRLLERPTTRGNSSKYRNHPLWDKVIESFKEDFNREVRVKEQKK